MKTVFDVNPEKLILKAAEELQKEKALTPPSWASFVKTGIHKERPPLQSNWWQIRAAAVLRTVYVQGPIGVSKLRQKYGGNKRRGVRPRHYRRASGNILRKCLQQLQSAGYLDFKEKGINKGRVVSGKGKKFLDGIAGSLEK